MRTSIVLTVLGPDRPGLVQEIARVVTGHDGNWEASRMARLAGRFAGILRVTAEEAAAEALAEDLRQLEPTGLRVIVDTSPDPGDTADERQVQLELLGNDHPGIIRDISAAIATRGISVVELATDCVEAPMAGGTLFRMNATLRCPSSVSEDDLRALLEELAGELMVDISLATS